MLKFQFIICFILLLFIKCERRVCRNQKGDEVDWFLIFLLPLKTTENILSYYYIDDTMDELKLFEHTDYSFPPNTLTKYALSKEKDFNFFFWNDDNTTKNMDMDKLYSNSSSYYAHSKGGLVYDNDTGAFLLTSLPRYPTRDSENNLYIEMPNNTGIYAQDFLCISINKNTSEKIVELLNYIAVSNNKCVEKDRVNYEPNPYVERLINLDYDYDSYPNFTESDISSLNRKKFHVISKSRKRNITPFNEDVTLVYKDSFYVRSWSKPSLSDPVCSNYEVLNVLNITIGDSSITKGQEHSKWAVAKEKNISCISDLNHVDSQAVRGGNIFCFTDKNIPNIMRNFIIIHDDCSVINN
jgi:hypothetical protein